MSRHSERGRVLGAYPFYKEKRWYLSPGNFRRVLEEMQAISDAFLDGANPREISRFYDDHNGLVLSFFSKQRSLENYNV